MRGEAFGLYVRRFLCPALRCGQIVVADNLSAHKGRGEARRLIEEAGCEPWFLPPYSPDLNPVEEAFSKMKGFFLRRAKARTFQTLVEAPGRALDAVSEEDAHGF